MADVVITAANVIPGANAKFRDGTAGATITAGQVVYSDSTDNGDYKLAQADAATTDDVIGIAVNGASDGQPIRVVYEDDDLTIGGTVAIGTIYVLSAAAGGAIAPSTDLASTNLVTVLGPAKTTGKIMLKIQVTSAAVA